MSITSTEEKAQRRLEVKARSTLMMGIPNEHQLKFNSIKDAKKLLEVIENRFDGHVATKKTQMNLLKQQYENFTASINQVVLNLYMRTWNKFIQMIWKMAMLTMRARKFLKKTRKKVTVNGNETIGFDKSKVECYNCHKNGHFVRECRTPRNQDNKHKKSSRRSVPMETSTSIALVSCDGLGGYDWSDHAEEGPDYVLMAFSSSSSDSKFWSTAMAKTINGEVQLHAKIKGKKIIVTESFIRRDLRLADKEDEAIHKELGDSLVRAVTIASSLEAELDSEMFNVDDLGGEEVFVAEQEVVSTAATTVRTEELTLSQALKALKTSKPKATLFQQLLEKRIKHFVAKRAKEKRNKPPTQAQKKKIMCNYLKNMEGYTLKQLKLKEFDEIQEMLDKAFRRVNTFEDFRLELVEGKEKTAGYELIQESTKKQKVEDNKEIVKLKN
uniref:CCHC-type domain-containing protein n=1 Tax=Tanacetum cinerariifolium TaxID=118510 RepID=A0A699HTM4_TANCI|nr:hypothetical protein [Tanacetum cinerariifolium]